MTKPIFIIGSGGHAKVLYECLLSQNNHFFVNFVEIDPDKIGKKIEGVKIIYQDDFLKNHLSSEVLLLNGLGSVDEPIARKKTFEFFKKRGYQFQTVIHPSAYVAKNVMLGEGCQILAGAILQIGTVLKDNVVINTRASVDHDCYIGHHSHIAPGATLSGGVFIGDTCHIGTAATVVQGVQIQKNTLVAAGSVVISNLTLRSRVAGVPAKAI